MKRTLVDRAKGVDRVRLADADLSERVDLAIEYFSGRITMGQVRKAMKFNTDARVFSFCAGALGSALRRGMIRVVRVEGDHQ